MRDRRKVIAWLNAFGYLENSVPEASKLVIAVKAMQKRYGLKQDGFVGPITDRAMGLFRCGNPDIQRMRIPGSPACKWNKNRITYYHSPAFRLPGVGHKKAAEIVAASAAFWSQYIPLKIVKARTRSRADVVIDWGRRGKGGFDGPGNVLAWAEMPCNEKDVQIRQMYDWDEPWAVGHHRLAGVLAIAVFAHEWGHTLGLVHSRSDTDLMAPFYNPAIYMPQPGDVATIQRIYGRPVEGTPMTVSVEGTLTMTGRGAQVDLRFVG